jgi:hypothetical protein
MFIPGRWAGAMVGNNRKGKRFRALGSWQGENLCLRTVPVLFILGGVTISPIRRNS